MSHLCNEKYCDARVFMSTHISMIVLKLSQWKKKGMQSAWLMLSLCRCKSFHENQTDIVPAVFSDAAKMLYIAGLDCFSGDFIYGNV